MKRSISVFESAITTSEILACEDFNEAIKLAATKEGWTMVDLANQFGYTNKHFWEITTGRQKFSIENAKRLADITGIDIMFWLRLYINKYIF